MLFSNFKEHLKQELFNRSQRDPEYSIRKLARDLEFDPSVMVKILNGKRKATPKTIKEIGVRLGLQDFCLDHYIEAYNKSIQKRKFESYENIDNDMEAYVSHWLHVSVLMLTYTRGFRADPTWIAERLNVDEDEAVESLALLKRLGALKNENGKWINTYQQKTTVGMDSNPKVNQLVRQTKHSMLDQSNAIMKDLDEDQYSNHFVTFAGSKYDKQIFYKKFIKFFESVKKDTRVFQERGEFEDVYRINVSLFPMTK